MIRTSMRLVALAALAVGLLLVLFRAGESVSASPSLQNEMAAGKKVYEARCQYCHGAQGKGDGPGAAAMYPRPRDFTSSAFKIRSTESGDAPTDADLVKIVNDGMPGTTMPAWRGVLSDAEIRQVVAYLKSFDARLFDPQSPPKPIQLSGAAPGSSQASIEKGKTLYQELQCWKCHGQQARGDGPSAFELKDKLDNKILPADLTKPWNFRGGASAQDLFRTLSTGLTGTPMPSFADSTSDQERWDLVNYLRSLAPTDKRPEAKAVLSAKRVEGALPADANSDVWWQAERFYFPLVGQLVHEPRLFTPAIDLVVAQALYNESEIAILVSWNDRAEDKKANGDDGLAIQFPNVIPDALERPYFILGDANHPVNLWQWQASTGKIEEANATGLNSITVKKPDSQNARGAVTFRDGQYQMVVRRALNTNDKDRAIQFAVGKLIPIAVSGWDGGSGEGGAKRSVSSWYSLYLEPPTPASAYLSIPIAIGLVLIVEGAVVWYARRKRQ
ncbi:MAG: c-type cytochrome [Chloroflexi bacterium]|nr:c-type cytochrome [Chloroflexota bacterium]